MIANPHVERCLRVLWSSHPQPGLISFGSFAACPLDLEDFHDSASFPLKPLLPALLSAMIAVPASAQTLTNLFTFNRTDGAVPVAPHSGRWPRGVIP